MLLNIKQVLPVWVNKSIQEALSDGSMQAVDKVVHKLLGVEDLGVGVAFDAFFSQAKKGGFHEACMYATHVLLENDQALLVQKHADWRYVDEWCCGHLSTIVEKCPKVFDAWTHSKPLVVKTLGVALLKELNEAQRASFLDGTNVQGPVAVRLRQLLEENPKNWESMPIAWLGTVGSAHRRAAMNLGLTRETVHVKIMQDKGLAMSFSDWIGVVENAFSIAALLRLMEERQQGGVHASKRAAEKLLGCGRVEQQFGADVNPVDVALGNMICEHHAAKVFLWKKHPDAPEIAQEERAHLQELLNLCLELDCLPVLLDKLLRNELTTTIEATPLPSLVGFEARA